MSHTKIGMINRKRLQMKGLSRRVHDLDASVIEEVGYLVNNKRFRSIETVAGRIQQAKKKGGAIILMLGAHVVRSGVQKFIIDLMENDYLTHIAMNGAGMIHDFEFSLIGATTENVSRYIKTGEFGMWNETGQLNDIINRTYRDEPDTGMGWVIGKTIEEGDYLFKSHSLMAAGYRLGIPVTIHVSIGQDIIHQHPNCDGAATGALSYNDFLCLGNSVAKLENGVIMNFGSAVMAPEVFLKALSMARNVARQDGFAIHKFTSLVCDLHDLPEQLDCEPPKDNHYYYFRPWKTMLVRTVKDGGEGYYQRGLHKDTIPSLWNSIKKLEK